MSGINSSKTQFRVAELPQNKAVSFSIVPDAEELKQIAQELDVVSLRKLRFEGKIAARGKRNWSVKGQLGVTVGQTCVVSLVPVNTRIDTPIERVLSADFAQPTDEEYELTDDDSVDPLEDVIDLQEIMLEELGLAIPLYPRAKDADLEESVFTEPGQTPMRDEDARPFATLAGLRDQLAKKDDK